MGLPWLDQPVMLHSSRADECDLKPQQCAYRAGHWRYWYQADRVYGHATIYFMCATIGVFILGHAVARVLPSSLSTTSIWRRIQAGLRYLAYRSFRIKLTGYWTPSLAVILLGAAGIIYFMSLTLGPKPYYWPNSRDDTVMFGDSPPIATRTGWMALALMPFVFILSTKANIISALTGISYEKLQVFHQWVGYAMFVLALVHTFPFIVYHIWKGDMAMQYEMSIAYWSGIACLVPQAWLTMMSFPYIRNMFYEFFKATHYLATALFVVLLFLHCDFTLTSWDYFVATAAFYVSSLLYSQFRTYLRYGFSHRATLALLPSGMVRVLVPANFRWKPGQHMFMRFLTLGLNTLTTHPFTICSLPPKERNTWPEKAESEAETSGLTPELAFYITPTAGGFTAKLARLAKKGAEVGVLLDGPYGGVKSMARFDKVVIIAGGSGAGFTLPVIEDILRDQGTGNVGRKTRIRVVLATRSPETLVWFSESVEALCGNGNIAIENVNVEIHVTSYEAARMSIDAASVPTVDEEKGLMENVEQGVAVLSRSGRPDIKEVVGEETRDAAGTVGIAVCGPASMLYDTRNAVADAELRILRGRGPKEVYLHSEHFGY